MQRTKLPKIRGFYLTITPKDSFINLEIEEESTGKIFAVNIDNDAISEKTNSIFEDPQSFMQGLQDAADQKCRGFELILGRETLKYRVILPTEPERELSFHLELPEKHSFRFVITELNARREDNAKLNTKFETLQNDFQTLQRNFQTQLMSFQAQQLALQTQQQNLLESIENLLRKANESHKKSKPAFEVDNVQAIPTYQAGSGRDDIRRTEITSRGSFQSQRTHRNRGIWLFSFCQE